MNFETIKQKFQTVDINTLASSVVSGAVTANTTGIVQLLFLILSLTTGVITLSQSKRKESLNHELMKQDIESKRIDNLIKSQQLIKKGDEDAKEPTI